MVSPNAPHRATAFGRGDLVVHGRSRLETGRPSNARLLFAALLLNLGKDISLLSLARSVLGVEGIPEGFEMDSDTLPRDLVRPVGARISDEVRNALSGLRGRFDEECKQSGNCPCWRQWADIPPGGRRAKAPICFACHSITSKEGIRLFRLCCPGKGVVRLTVHESVFVDVRELDGWESIQDEEVLKELERRCKPSLLLEGCNTAWAARQRRHYEGVLEGIRGKLYPGRSAPYRVNLPQQLTSFIGREDEIADIKQWLASFRLVTVTGAGGTGKTRLVLQVTQDLIPAYPDGVWLVELAALTDPDLVVQTVAAVLRVREVPGQPLIETLIAHLQSRHLLLVLDTCEHLVVPCARLADRLLRACGQVQILATSREALGIPGEHSYRIPSLPVPPELTQAMTAEQLWKYDAVRLFVERAQVVVPSFELIEQNAPPVVQICRRLDGIPLAIELAAARARTLSAQQIAAHLDDLFRLLTGGSRTALPHQQTLRAAIDWSYDLLNEKEKALLRRLSTFAGGWTLEAAEAVCADTEQAESDSQTEIERLEVLDLLTHLFDKSLVIAETTTNVTRYRTLDTLRQYSQEKLRKSGESEKVCEKHQRFFLQLVEEAGPQLYTDAQDEWHKRLEQEHDNLRTALEWKGGSDWSKTSLRMAVALLRFWEDGRAAEGFRHVEEALSHPDTQERTIMRARASHVAGTLATMLGKYDQADKHLHQSLLTYQEIKTRPETGQVQQPSDLVQAEIGIGEVYRDQGVLALDRQQIEEAAALFEKSLALFRKLLQSGIAERRISAALAIALSSLGNATNRLPIRNRDKARAYFEESLSIREQLGDYRTLVSSYLDMAHVSSGDEATEYASRALTIATAHRYASGIAWSLSVLALLDIYRGEFGRALDSLIQSAELFHQQNIVGGQAEVLKGWEALAKAHEDFEPAERISQALTDWHNGNTGALERAIEELLNERNAKP